MGSASLTIWTTQLSTLESRAAEQDRFSSELISHIADPLKNLAARYEELRKHHAEYAAKLEKERDISYGNLKKTKSRYDGACQEVENKRRKIDSSFDRSKQKAQNTYQQQIMDMHNVKVRLYLSTDFTLFRGLMCLEYISHRHQHHQQAKRTVLSRVRSRSTRRKSTPQPISYLCSHLRRNRACKTCPRVAATK